MLDFPYCDMPERMHPVSRMFLDAFLDGSMPYWDFLRFFSLPNSDYIPLAQCIVQTASGLPGL